MNHNHRQTKEMSTYRAPLRNGHAHFNHADIKKRLPVKCAGLKTFKAAPEKLNPGEKKSEGGDGGADKKLQHVSAIITVVTEPLFRLNKVFFVQPQLSLRR